MQGHIGFSLVYTDSRVILYTYQSDKISVRSIVDAFQSQDISLNKKIKSLPLFWKLLWQTPTGFHKDRGTPAYGTSP